VHKKNVIESGRKWKNSINNKGEQKCIFKKRNTNVVLDLYGSDEIEKD
jgi:uncharacterized protein involved in tolerance to divalent cations